MYYGMGVVGLGQASSACPMPPELPPEAFYDQGCEAGWPDPDELAILQQIAWTDREHDRRACVCANQKTSAGKAGCNDGLARWYGTARQALGQQLYDLCQYKGKEAMPPPSSPELFTDGPEIVEAPPPAAEPVQAGMSTGTMIAIGAGVVGVAGVAYLLLRKKKG